MFEHALLKLQHTHTHTHTHTHILTTRSPSSWFDGKAMALKATLGKMCVFWRIFFCCSFLVMLIHELHFFKGAPEAFEAKCCVQGVREKVSVFCFPFFFRGLFFKVDACFTVHVLHTKRHVLTYTHTHTHIIQARKSATVDSETKAWR